ncbi:uncharacterized protein [Nicotiana tomentosiformis]|uniref:uncharacterized protein n=1 Tax=Nicotiana tomentosiformis TaxID=4098 RepID=UPI00388CA337
MYMIFPANSEIEPELRIQFFRPDLQHWWSALERSGDSGRSPTTSTGSTVSGGCTRFNVLVVRGILHTEKLFIGGDFNGHIGATSGGYDDVHDCFSFGDRNERRTFLLDFAKAFDLVIVNSSFPKKEEHLVTFQSSIARIQIDYLLFRKSNKGLYADCKVIPSENRTIQHRLMVKDLEIRRKRRKKVVYGLPRIKYGSLTKEKAQKLGDKLLSIGAWSNSWDASGIWTATANHIREADREVFGVLKGSFGGRKRDWWWSTEVQGKVEAKKAAYLKLLESADEEEKWTYKERYKVAKTEAKLVVTAAKTIAFECLYKVLQDKCGDKNMYMLAKVRERKVYDSDQVKCIKDEEGRVLLDEALIRRRCQPYFHKLLNEEGYRNIVLGGLEHSDSR